MMLNDLCRVQPSKQAAIYLTLQTWNPCTNTIWCVALTLLERRLWPSSRGFRRAGISKIYSNGYEHDKPEEPAIGRPGWDQKSWFRASRRR